MALLREATRRYRRAEAAMVQRREELHTAVISALMSGERPRDVVEMTGLTTEHVRRLAREHGVPPRGAGGKL